MTNDFISYSHVTARDFPLVFTDARRGVPTRFQIYEVTVTCPAATSAKTDNRRFG